MEEPAPDQGRADVARRPRTVRYCRAPELLRAVRSATANVERHVPELNALNVYPVPDGDTGINMFATMRAALAEVEAVSAERPSLGDIAAAVSLGALMGARGNSGVILSQVFRGMAESVAGKRRADGRDLAEALLAGTRTAYGAVARPVEGTILTVARAAAQAAMEAAEAGRPLGAVLAEATEAARRAVDGTPEQLDVLREAGVVDAGGQGLYRALQGALRVVPGAPAPADELLGTPPLEPSVALPAATHRLPEGDGGWGYETVFLLQPHGQIDVEALRGRLAEVGESVLVAGDARLVKVHVHNERPDAVLAVGLSLGTLSEVAIENLEDRRRERHAGRGREVPPGELAVVAVAAGAGFAEIFASFGVEQVILAPRAGNPSTRNLVGAIRRTGAPDVVVLPNDPNVVLAAEQAAQACADRTVVVVPTRSAPEGFAALLALERTKGAQANLAPMLAAAREVETFAVAVADREARRAGRPIRRGQFVVIRPGEGIAAVGKDAPGAVAEALEALAPRYELLTFYLGDGATREEADEIARVIGQRRPGTEIEVMAGGQPHYRYLISAE